MDGAFTSDFSRDSFGMLHDFAQMRDLTYSLLQDTSTGQSGPVPSDFSLLNHFSRLLWQQGRVILDADLNEQVDILLYTLHSLARDLIGPQGGPASYYDEKKKEWDTGFTLYTSDQEKELRIRRGHYYVDGILVSNEENIAYTNQPYLPPDADIPHGNDKGYLAYLDIWERQVTALENGLIREVALSESGPDTATRAQLVWQVKILDLDPYGELADRINHILSLSLNNKNQRLARYEEVNILKRYLEDLLQSPTRHCLAAKAKEPTEEDQNNACIIPPAASYRGPENQLYRVEIHREGPSNEATFVVSRENGSVLFRILSGQEPEGNTDTVTIVLDDLGRDDSRFALSKDDWVELVDENNVLSGVPGPLYQVSAPPDPVAMTVTLTPAKSRHPKGIDASRGQLLRKWNYRGSTTGKGKAGAAKLADDGALEVKENTWFELENGIQIQFQPPKEEFPGAKVYRTGDYWLIPARTITNNVIWPQQPPWQPPSPSADLKPALLLPHGVRHHYAPLARLSINADKIVTENISLQYLFKSLVELSL
jgi:hypothetical protein